MRDELLNCEIFDTMQEAKVLTEKWKTYYNTISPIVLFVTNHQHLEAEYGILD
jgi:hypothetical protein